MINIIMTVNKNWQRILLKCKICGEPFWVEVDLKSYYITEKDLICDAHYNEDGELMEENEDE